MRGVVGIILAGGESTRMGTDKALFEMNGRTMAEWVADAMCVFETAGIVGRRRGLAGLDAIPDLRSAGTGPLSGLHTALSAFGRPLVVVAVDQPLVRSETLLRLAGLAAEGETAICIDDRPQVTCASYTPACLEEATRQLRSGGSIQQMLRSVLWTPIRREVWSRWGEDGRSWFSMDTPDSIITAEQRFRLNLLG